MYVNIDTLIHIYYVLNQIVYFFQKNIDVQLKDVACQGDVLNKIMQIENSEEMFLNSEECPVPIDPPDSVIDNNQWNQMTDDIKYPERSGSTTHDEGKVDPENLLQMEESMNELEEGMFGSEPFSLDLCSVRLQSEGQSTTPDMLLPPSSQLTDEEQWSDSGSDIRLLPWANLIAQIIINIQ